MTERYNKQSVYDVEASDSHKSRSKSSLYSLQLIFVIFFHEVINHGTSQPPVKEGSDYIKGRY